MIDVVPNAGVIALGKQGENQAVRVTLPNIRAGSGSILLLHQRAADQQPYPVPVVEADGGIIWTVSSTDTAYPGRGQAELQWLGADGAVIKSVTYQTNIIRALTAPGAVPDEPLKPYTQAVAQSAQAAKDAAASATEAARSAEASSTQAGLSAAAATEAARNAEAIVGQAGQAAQEAQAAALAAAQDAAAAETAEAGANQAQTGAEAARTEAQTARTEAQTAKAAAEKAAQEAKTAQTGAVEAKTGAETAQAKAEEAAQGIAADREQIGANTAGLEAAQQDVTELKAENTALKADTARTARSLDYLWKKSKGIIYDTETVTGDGSSVTVPSGAMDYAALRKLGGMSRKGRNLLDITRYTPFSRPDSEITTTVDANAVVFDVPIIDKKWQVWRINLADIGPGTYVVTINMDSSDTEFTPQLSIYRYDGKDSVLLTMLLASGAKTVTIPDGNTMTLYFHACTSSGAKVPRTVRYTNVMISKTAVAYEPYTDSLLDAPVDAVRVANAAGDSTNTYPIPQAIRDLCPDYGIGVSADCYNYIDFAAKQYHHRVGQVDLGTLTWTMQQSKIYESYYFASQSIVSTPHAAAFLTADYTPLKSAEVLAVDRSCWVSYNWGDNGRVIIRDDRYNDAASFTAAMTGKILYCELATPEIIDLSAMWPDDDFGVLRVEAGGTINLHYPALDDGFELAVPSETEIMVDVAKVVQTNG